MKIKLYSFYRCMEIFVYDERAGRVDNNQDVDGETMTANNLNVIMIKIIVLHECMKTI